MQLLLFVLLYQVDVYHHPYLLVLLRIKLGGPPVLGHIQDD